MRFLFLLNMYMSGPKKVSVPKDFRLLGVWFTEFTLYQPFSISGFSFKNAHVEKIHGKVFVSKKWFKWLKVI